jgi:transcriptional regulator
MAKRAKVKALREDGWVLSRIAAEMGVTTQAVSLMLKAIREAESPAAG